VSQREFVIKVLVDGNEVEASIIADTQTDTFSVGCNQKFESEEECIAFGKKLGEACIDRLIEMKVLGSSVSTWAMSSPPVTAPAVPRPEIRGCGYRQRNRK
jgi:hypothetical protein